jgi:hypothetical protein
MCNNILQVLLHPYPLHESIDIKMLMLQWILSPRIKGLTPEIFLLSPWKCLQFIGLGGSTTMGYLGKWLRIWLHELGFDPNIVP